MEDLCNKPLVAPPYTSYRCRGRYGWIMIGAMSTAEAWQEAQRSSLAEYLSSLQIWDGNEYADVIQESTNAAN